MRRAWRIVKEKHAISAFDGEGARTYGGRWNSQGNRVVYTSASLSLASLESLVHLTPPVIFGYVAIPVDFDPSIIESFPANSLPTGWQDEPPPPSSKAIGDAWLSQSRSAVLELPSAIIPGEFNYLINPEHPDFRKIVIGKAIPFSFNSRLL